MPSKTYPYLVQWPRNGHQIAVTLDGDSSLREPTEGCVLSDRPTSCRTLPVFQLSEPYLHHMKGIPGPDSYLSRLLRAIFSRLLPATSLPLLISSILRRCISCTSLIRPGGLAHFHSDLITSPPRPVRYHDVFSNSAYGPRDGRFPLHP